MKKLFILLFIFCLPSAYAQDRLPTKDELESLVEAGSVWTSLSGMNGRRFGTGANTIFIPALDESYEGENTNGNIWASTLTGIPNQVPKTAYQIYFDETAAYKSHNNVYWPQSIRCVKDVP